MNENQQKETFPHGENQKSSKIGFPNIGKNKKCHWLYFPTLGKTENSESLLSDFRGSVHFDTSSCRHHAAVHDRGLLYGNIVHMVAVSEKVCQMLTEEQQTFQSSFTAVYAHSLTEAVDILVSMMKQPLRLAV